MLKIKRKLPILVNQEKEIEVIFTNHEPNIVRDIKLYISYSTKVIINCIAIYYRPFVNIYFFSYLMLRQSKQNYIRIFTGFYPKLSEEEDDACEFRTETNNLLCNVIISAYLQILSNVCSKTIF